MYECPCMHGSIRESPYYLQLINSQASAIELAVMDRLSTKFNMHT
jgi:hypothetical protein